MLTYLLVATLRGHLPGTLLETHWWQLMANEDKLVPMLLTYLFVVTLQDTCQEPS